jgi:hypothetical protein
VSCDTYREAVLSRAAGEGASAELDSHLAECPGCREFGERLGTLTTLLADVPYGPAPAPGLEENVFSLVELDHVARAAEHIGPRPPLDLEHRSLTRAGVVVEGRWSRRRALGALVPAAVLLISLVGMIVMQPWSDDDPSAPAAFTGQLMQNVNLDGTNGSMSADLMKFEQQNYGLVVRAEGLPLSPEGTYYEVWMIGAAGEVPAGTFRVLRAEDQVFRFQVGVDPTHYSRVVVTLERDDGDPRRAGRPVMEGWIDTTKVSP